MPDENGGAHRVVSRDEWIAARTAFLEKEKEFTRLRDELSRQRRESPLGGRLKELLVRGAERPPDAARAV